MKATIVALVVSLVAASLPSRAFACVADEAMQYQAAPAAVVAQVIAVNPPWVPNVTDQFHPPPNNRFVLTIQVKRFLKGAGSNVMQVNADVANSCSPLGRDDPTGQYFVGALQSDLSSPGELTMTNISVAGWSSTLEALGPATDHALVALVSPPSFPPRSPVTPNDRTVATITPPNTGSGVTPHEQSRPAVFASAFLALTLIASTRRLTAN